MKRFSIFLIAIMIFLQTAFLISAKQPNSFYETVQSESTPFQITPKEQYRDVFHVSHTETAVLEYEINCDTNYDYITISYASSENIELQSYQTTTLAYQNSENTFLIAFNTSDDSITSQLDIANTSEGKIYFTIKAYADNIVKQELTQNIGVYITPYGDFISTIDIEFSEISYYDWLFTEGIINATTYNQLERSMHLPDFEIEGFMQPLQNAVCSSVSSSLSSVHNEIQEKIQLQMQNTWYRTEDTDSNITQSQLFSNLSINPTTVTFTYTIASLNQGEQLNIYGYLYWTDSNGISHVAKNNLIKVYDEDTIGSDLLTTTSTNVNGYFNVTVDNQTGILDNGCDIYIEVYAQTNDIPIQAIRQGGSLRDHYMVTPTISDVMTSQPPQTQAVTDTLFAKAVCVAQAFNIGIPYVSAMNNGVVYKPDAVNYPGIEGSASFYNSTFNSITISDSYKDWDVILHEYGHCVAYNMEIEDSPGGDHSYSWNMALHLEDKSKGIRLAWSEGWATYFSISAQLYMNAASLNIPGVGNTCMDYINSEIENNSSEALGEANEQAVSRILLDLADNTPSEARDNINLGYQTVWNIAKDSGSTTLSEYITAVYNYMGRTIENYGDIGKLLSDQNVAASPIGISQSSSNTLLFSYNKPEECEYLSYEYEIILTLSPQISSSITLSANQSSEYLLTEEQYNLIQSVCPDGFYWCVINKDTQNTPETGPYYSEFYYYTYE